MKFSKALCLLLSLIMIITALAACTNENLYKDSDSLSEGGETETGTTIQLVSSQNLSCDIRYNRKFFDNLVVNGNFFLMSGNILITEIDDTLAMVYNVYDEFSSVLTNNTEMKT